MIETIPAPNDVIQLNPEYSHGWGPLLCIVEKVHAWGVTCYAIHPEKRFEPPARMYLRVEHDHYVRIGKAEWVVQ